MELGLVTFAAIFGWLLGFFVSYKYLYAIFSKSMKAYTETMTTEYRKCLDKMRIQYINKSSCLNEQKKENITKTNIETISNDAE